MTTKNETQVTVINSAAGAHRLEFWPMPLSNALQFAKRHLWGKPERQSVDERGTVTFSYDGFSVFFEDATL